jgi:hypothetical protein
MDPLFVGVIVGSLGTILVGALYMLWARTTKKEPNS